MTTITEFATDNEFQIQKEQIQIQETINIYLIYFLFRSVTMFFL